MQISQSALELHIREALDEDRGDGDHTSLSTISKDAQGSAKLIVKEKGILAGIEVALNVFKIVDPELNTEVFIRDGASVSVSEIAFELHGRIQSILLAERLALNYMQRMSGIATTTDSFVRAIQGTSATILDTRKTTPGFRMFEKWAVKIGGGGNHRSGLFDMILIKDNHVDYAGGITNAINSANSYLKATQRDLPIEIETRNLKEVEQVLEVGKVTRIMLDNFKPEELYKAVELIDKQFETEASGGITLNTVREFAETGVDFISCGALTHSYNSLDLSLKAKS